MTPETFAELLTPRGLTAIAEAAARHPTDATALQVATALRKHFPTELATAALETVLLREKAKVKFRDAARMYFTREALEVASGEIISAYRAERFRPYETVGDFACGIGGDTLGLAADGRTVAAVDSDPLRVMMAEANAAACGYSDRVSVIRADLLEDPLPPVQAAFADPGRRADGQRFLSITNYLPPPGEILKRLPGGVPVAFKLAPGVNRDEVLSYPVELEFISVGGELKESVLWFRDLRTTARRATLLPGRQTLAAEVPDLPREPRPIGQFLYDPAAAVVRAGLETNLATMLDAQPADAGVAMLTSDTVVETPLATAYRVEAVLPFHLKKLTAHVAANGIGRVTVVQCGSGAVADADQISKKCKGRGEAHRFVVLTRELGRPVAVVAERTEPEA